MTNEKLREALNALERVEAWMLSEEGAFMDSREGERDLKTIRAALSSTDSQSVGDDDATARRYLRDAVANRDPTGASMRKMNQFGTVDEGAAVDAIMAALSASPAVQSEPSGSVATQAAFSVGAETFEKNGVPPLLREIVRLHWESGPSGDDVERARAVLAECWRDEGRPHLADTIARGRDSEWSKSDVAIKAMLKFSAMSSREAGLREAATALLDKLDIVTKEAAGVFAEMYARGRPYDGPNFSDEYDALRAALNAGGDRG